MMINDVMSAAVLMGHLAPLKCGYDKLEIRYDWPRPRPQAGEVLIRVAACGVNNTDINTRIGWYDDAVMGDTTSAGANGFDLVADDSVGGWGGTLKFPRIQGADICGHVVALGQSVATEWLNARVFNDPWLRNWAAPMDLEQTGYVGSECDGGFAQYVALPVTNLARVNCDWADSELATLPCSYTTAENMLTRARVTAGESILITGASGGVGSALIQLAKRRETTVIALTTASKADQLLALGADATIRRGVDDWRDVIWATTGSEKVDVAADVVGQPLFAQLMGVLRRGGCYVVAGAIGGKQVTVDLSHLYLRDWNLIGATVTTTDIFPNLVSYVERGEIRPFLAQTYPLSDIYQAQTDFLAKKHIGKLVITLSE